MSELIRRVTVGELVDALKEELDLTWIAGQDGAENTLTALNPATPAAGLIGPFDCDHPHPISLMGAVELKRFDTPEFSGHRETITRLRCGPTVILLTERLAPFTELTMLAEESATPLLQSPLPAGEVSRELERYLSLRLSNQEVRHGVFAEVHGIGILLTGQPGVGKSELALELVHRGHRLIADDAPLFTRTAPERIEGSCPPLLQDFLEVRGLGFINMRTLFGDSAIRLTKRLHLIVHLQPMDEKTLSNLDRLNWNHRHEKVVGVEVDQVTLPLAPGRELAILVETVARLFSQRSRGYDASADFLRRQAEVAAMQHPVRQPAD